MQKKALSISCYVAAAGAFGAFFRWLQNQTAFEAETGLPTSSVLNYIVPAVIIAAALLFASLVKKLRATGLTPPESFTEIYRSTHLLYPVAYYVTSLVLAVGGVASMLSSDEELGTHLVNLVGFLALVCGLCFPIVCRAPRKKYSPSLVSFVMTLPIVMFALYLITSYRINASNPSVYTYAIEILAICAACVAFYYTAGAAFGKFKPYRSIFAAELGAFMCFTTLADTRIFGLRLVFIGSALMLLIENWMLIMNMSEPKPAQEPAENTPQEPASEPFEPVIRAEESSFINEPTLTAPDPKSKKLF